MDPITRESYKKVLVKRSFLPLIEQAKVDRDNGKTLCPKMDRVVNIYSQVLADYPGPVVQEVAQ